MTKALSFFLLVTCLASMLFSSVSLRASSPSPPYPELNPGDSWRYVYSSGETSLETIQNSVCDGTPCTIDTESSRRWSDTTWKLSNWEYLKENFTDPTGNRFYTFKPNVRLYDWPLVVGKQWTIDVSVSEVQRNATGVYLYDFRWLQTQRVTAQTNVTVPAGRFNAFVVEEYRDSILHSRKWFSYEAKNLVQWELYSDGRVTDRSYLLSCSQSACNGLIGRLTSFSSIIPLLVPILLILLGAWFGLGAIASVMVVYHERRKRRQLVEPAKRFTL